MPGKSVLDLESQIDTRVHVKFTGGREVEGVLKGFDDLVNVVLDDAVEILKEASDSYTPTGKVRKLGLMVCRGPAVMLISPMEGREEVANPFEADDDEEDDE